MIQSSEFLAKHGDSAGVQINHDELRETLDEFFSAVDIDPAPEKRESLLNQIVALALEEHARLGDQ